MKYKEIALKSIKKHEGLELFPYICTAGKITIGYGRNLEDKGISNEEASKLLEKDMEESINQSGSFEFFSDLDDTRKAVIVEMVFNLGLNGVKKFKKMIKALNNRDYQEASVQMLDSRWAKQVGQRAITLSTKLRDNS